MVKRESHVGKSFIEKSKYFTNMIKTAHEEKETFEEKDFDGTDTSTVEEKIDIRKKIPRWQDPKKIFTKKAKNYWWLPIVVTVSLWFISSLLGINRDIAKLEERTKDIPFIKEKIISIDKNIEMMKIVNEKNDEIYNFKIRDLQKRIDELSKEKK